MTGTRPACVQIPKGSGGLTGQKAFCRQTEGFLLAHAGLTITDTEGPVQTRLGGDWIYEPVRIRVKHMTDDELIAEIEAQRSLMVTVATGGPRIQEVNQQYVERHDRISADLRRRGLEDQNPHGDLWAWYGRWSSGDMPTWASRRAHLSEMYQPLIDQVRIGPSATGAELFQEPTGWPRVDRSIYELRRRLEQAVAEEQFQAVGLLCRETLISVAQVVYDPQRHSSTEGVVPSETDAKRMLDSYIAVELAGGPNEGVRRHAKAALALANGLLHHRTADYRQAALCAEATTSVVNLIAIISGRRDRPQ